LLCCAYASYCTENKTEQAEGKLVQAASFWTFLCKCSCSMPAASLRKLEIASQSWLVLLNTQGVTNYHCVCLLRAAQLSSWGPAVNLVSLSQTCCWYRRHTCYKRLLRRTQKGVLVDLLSLEGLPLAHTVALHISVGACTYCWSDEYLWALLHMNATCVWSMLRTIVNISSHSVGSHEVTARVHMRLIAKNHLVIIEIFVSQVACKLVAELHNFTKLGSNMRPHCSHALHTLGTVCDHHACTPLLKHNLHQLAMLPSCNICPTQLSKTSFHYTLILAYASLAWQAHCTVYRT